MANRRLFLFTLTIFLAAATAENDSWFNFWKPWSSESTSLTMPTKASTLEVIKEGKAISYARSLSKKPAVVNEKTVKLPLSERHGERAETKKGRKKKGKRKKRRRYSSKGGKRSKGRKSRRRRKKPRKSSGKRRRRTGSRKRSLRADGDSKQTRRVRRRQDKKRSRTLQVRRRPKNRRGGKTVLKRRRRRRRRQPKSKKRNEKKGSASSQNKPSFNALRKSSKNRSEKKGPGKKPKSRNPGNQRSRKGRAGRRNRKLPQHSRRQRRSSRNQPKNRSKRGGRKKKSKNLRRKLKATLAKIAKGKRLVESGQRKLGSELINQGRNKLRNVQLALVKEKRAKRQALRTQPLSAPATVPRAATLNLHYEFTSAYPMTCSCMPAHGLKNGVCWTFTDKWKHECKKRMCKPQFVCVVGASTGITCMKKMVTKRIVSTGPGICREEAKRSYIYVPYA